MIGENLQLLTIINTKTISKVGNIYKHSYHQVDNYIFIILTIILFNVIVRMYIKLRISSISRLCCIFHT